MMAAVVTITDVLDTSTRMLALAQAGDWNGLGTAAVERDRLLQQLPTADTSMLDALETLLAHNERIRTLVGDARDELGQALGQHQRTHRALNAYLHTAIG
jgi:hypothetical protein